MRLAQCLPPHTLHLNAAILSLNTKTRKKTISLGWLTNNSDAGMATANCVASFALLPLLLVSVSHVVCYSDSFYIRQYNGTCLEYIGNSKAFYFSAVCKFKFHWSSGARLMILGSSHCLHVGSTTDGSYLTLSENCNTTSSLFQYDESNHVLIHLASGKCLEPQNISSGTDDRRGPVVIKGGCNQAANKYYFRARVHYTIMHSSGLCWKYDCKAGRMRMEEGPVCDRFSYDQFSMLRHVDTGQCVSNRDGPYITLSGKCRYPKETWLQDKDGNIVTGSGKMCVHMENGETAGTLLKLVDTCVYGDRKFHFYDERGT